MRATAGSRASRRISAGVARRASALVSHSSRAGRGRRASRAGWLARAVRCSARMRSPGPPCLPSGTWSRRVMRTGSGPSAPKRAASEGAILAGAPTEGRSLGAGDAVGVPAPTTVGPATAAAAMREARPSRRRRGRLDLPGGLDIVDTPSPSRVGRRRRHRGSSPSRPDRRFVRHAHAVGGCRVCHRGSFPFGFPSSVAAPQAPDPRDCVRDAGNDARAARSDRGSRTTSRRLVAAPGRGPIRHLPAVGAAALLHSRVSARSPEGTTPGASRRTAADGP